METRLRWSGREGWGAGIAAALCGGFAFLLYLRTLAPTVLYYDLPRLRDSATLQAKAAVLGIPDYTGYPTYVMLTHLFTYLPFGDVAYRVNLASAVFGAVAVGFLSLAGTKLSGRVAAGVAGGLAFGVAPVFWSQAVIAEVYTLNALFVALVLCMLLVWRERRRDRYLLLAAFLMGLSLTHHLTSGLLLPAAVLLVLLVEPGKLLEWRLVLKGAGLFVLGLTPYLYLPIRASMDYLPEGYLWGQPLIQKYPPNTLYGFYNLVSGGQWKERMWAFGPAELPGRVEMYLEHMMGYGGQFGVWLVAAAAAGFLYLVYRDAPSAATLGFLYLGWLFYALEYDIEDVEYYFIPTYLVLALFMAAGFGGLIDAVRALGARLPAAPEAAAAFLAALFCVISPLGRLDATYARVDMSGDYRGREIIESVARNVERGATILHHRSPLDYMVLVEHRRTDLRLLPYLELPGPPGYVRAVRALQRGPVYILFPGRETTPYYLGVAGSERLYGSRGYDLVPVDREVLLYRVVPRPGALPPGELRPEKRA
ncbi:hypothetical protein RxyAA322_02100 [Rubrobacter xylanophilus]|uniref:DUF2723 domain-containing protein n=1 Tax=Rubrobacter xylanophilus TaxID=49319 RepID=A0A510HEJ3_9ACTN|nr:DUF2723 domain-containing protein [Rubrobacter xylanophilus]BBL78356.1 hypothetical protein RxyAA322_02100 [Rubrobacter xylanophilus]